MRHVSLKVIAAAAFFTAAVPALASDEVFRIEMNKDKYGSDRELRERVTQLERAVEQLQRKVFDLQRPGYAEPSRKMYSCYLKTPFDGVFSASEPSRTASVGKVLQKCSNAAKGSVFCKESEVKCDDSI